MKTFEAKIMLGLREGYGRTVRSIDEAHGFVQGFCDVVGLCVTFTETKFLYSTTPETPHGFDPGVIIGLIRYYPKSEFEIKETARHLARLLKKKFKQNRISIVFTDMTEIL